MITFKIGGLDYKLGWDDLVNEYDGKCNVRVSPLDVKRPGYSDFYIVGAVFLKKYYTIFDRLTNRVGFKSY